MAGRMPEMHITVSELVKIFKFKLRAGDRWTPYVFCFHHQTADKCHQGINL